MTAPVLCIADSFVGLTILQVWVTAVTCTSWRSSVISRRTDLLSAEEWVERVPERHRSVQQSALAWLQEPWCTCAVAGLPQTKSVRSSTRYLEPRVWRPQGGAQGCAASVGTGAGMHASALPAAAPLVGQAVSVPVRAKALTCTRLLGRRPHP